MAEIIWTEPALADLDAIADYIALDNSTAAMKLVQRVFKHVEQLIEHPDSGAYIPELDNKHYRQIIEPPCRVIYRADLNAIYILHVMRSEQLFRAGNLQREEHGQ